MKKSRKDLILTIIFIVLAVLINGYIIYHSCLSGAESSIASQGLTKLLENIINSIKPGTITETNYDAFATFVRKGIGHFGGFVSSGLLTSLAVYFSIKDLSWYKHLWAILISFGIGALVAGTTEIIQLSTPHRSGEFSDVMLDIAGYILGLLIILVIIFIVLKRQSTKNSTQQS